VGDGTARHHGSAHALRVRRRESIGVVTEVGGVLATELDGEVGSYARVAGIEAVRLAAGGGADEIYGHVHAAQRIDDRFAGRAGAGAGDDVHAVEAKRGQRLVGRASAWQARRGRIERRGCQAFAGHRIAAWILFVEYDVRDCAASGQRGVANHVGALAGQVEIAAAVVTQVEDQIGDVGVVELR